jgi:X-Pro dipeptidyl-peptidase
VRIRSTVVTLACVAVMTPPIAARAEPPALVPRPSLTYPTMVENVVVPTAVGDVYVRLTRPKVTTDARFPVALTYSPYALIGEGEIGLSYVKKGYVQAVADVIGTGNSGGCWDYGGPREQESALALLQWLGTQSWSNGKVAMYGGSYDGTTANMAAVADDPRASYLATIIPEVAISDWYSYAYGDGVRYSLMDPAQRQGLVVDEQGFDTPVSFDFVEGLVPPADRTFIQARPDAAAVHTVERPCPGTLDKIEHMRRGYDLDPEYDEFWEQRGYIGRASKVRVPVLVVGGWRDYNVKHSESSRWYDAIPLDDPSTAAVEGAPYKMLAMGQGAHGASDDAAFSKILTAWLDQFLYGFDSKILDQLPSRSRTNDGVLRLDASWPPPDTSDVRLHLTPTGGLTQAPAVEAWAPTTLLDTGRMTESEALRMRGTSSPEVAWFVTDELSADLRIAGTPRLDLFASTLGTSTQFTPVLFDLGPPADATDSLCTFVPAGQACVIGRGFLNARNAGGLAHGQDLHPTAPYRATVRFIDNDWVIPAGHRIGVAVMSSNVWWAVSDQQRALTDIAHDGAHPSALILPVVGGNTAASAAGVE